jgi:hypothetical protein
LTQPAQARRGSGRDAPRTYAWPPLPPHDLEVVSVTSALKALPKPFLIGWAAKMTAECAVDRHDLVGKMISDDGPRAAIDYLKGARYRDMNAKADRGTIVHAAVEAYMEGKPLSKAQVQEALQEARVPPKMWRSAAGMIAGAMEFLFDHEPDVLWSEATVYSRQHGYAGTADLIARMNVGGSIQPVVIDFKTSKAIYDEVSAQLCAYARADFVGQDDGTEAELVPGHPGPIGYGVCIRPMASGRYEKVTFALTDDLFDLFLGCLTVTNRHGAMASARRPG